MNFIHRLNSLFGSLVRNSCTPLGFLFGLSLVINILTMPAFEYEGDPMAIRSETVHLLNTGSLGVPPDLAMGMGERGQYFFENNEKGRWFPKYGILNTLVYLPVLFVEKTFEGSLPYASPQRVLYLNLFNLLITSLSFFYLYLIAKDYPVRPGTRMLFQFMAFYATFWWNYGRAQNSECYQMLFFLGFFHHFSNFLRRYRNTFSMEGSPDKQLLISMVFLAMLCHVKLLYVLILPCMILIVLAVVLRVEKMSFTELREGVHRRYGILIWQYFFPAMILCASIGLVNEYKFGSPWNTGYRQWTREADLFSGNFLEAFSGYIFSYQGSIFLHYPLLALALLAYRKFFRNHGYHAWILAILFPLFFWVCCNFVNWRGEWCYGPRYLLIFLPLMSLPFMLAWEDYLEKNGKLAALALKGAIVVVLIVSLLLQISVNSYPFMAYYQIRHIVRQWPGNRDIIKYFSAEPFGVINAHLLWHQVFGTELVIARKLRLQETDSEYLNYQLEPQTIANYYWWRKKAPEIRSD